MEQKSHSVAVIGGGSFGTALTKIFSDTLGHCAWWMHNSESAMHDALPPQSALFEFRWFKPEAISVFTDIEACVAEADIVVLAVPSAFVKEVLADLDPALLRKKIVATAIKGIIPDENMIVGRYLNEILKFQKSRL